MEGRIESRPNPGAKRVATHQPAPASFPKVPSGNQAADVLAIQRQLTGAHNSTVQPMVIAYIKQFSKREASMPEKAAATAFFTKLKQALPKFSNHARPELRINQPYAMGFKDMVVSSLREEAEVAKRTSRLNIAVQLETWANEISRINIPV